MGGDELLESLVQLIPKNPLGLKGWFFESPTQLSKTVRLSKKVKLDSNLFRLIREIAVKPNIQ